MKHIYVAKSAVYCSLHAQEQKVFFIIFHFNNDLKNAFKILDYITQSTQS